MSQLGSREKAIASPQPARSARGMAHSAEQMQPASHASVAVALRVCNQCGAGQPGNRPGYWLGRWYCSRECGHAAGDREACSGWECGCTRYAKKRRLLRRHREQMRVMMDLIEDNELEEILQDDMIDVTGNTGFWLGHISHMDEASDEEDPHAALEKEVAELRKEVADKQSLVNAVQGAIECRSVLTDLERARMQMEDFRSTIGAPDILAAALPLRA